MAGRPTVSDLRALKGKRQILTMHVDNVLEAAAGAEAGIDMFTFEVDDRIEGVRAAAPQVFIQAGCRQAMMASEESAIREAFRAMERGVDGIYFAGSLQIVESMAREGIPVTGHVGYVPLRRTWTGVRAVGKTPEEAAAVFRKVKALENAGGWAVEMEIVPFAAIIAATAEGELTPGEAATLAKLVADFAAVDDATDGVRRARERKKRGVTSIFDLDL
jgi:3-methyl-2-oxobutanoate hydroxymethyltransferase